MTEISELRHTLAESIQGLSGQNHSPTAVSNEDAQRMRELLAGAGRNEASGNEATGLSRLETASAPEVNPVGAGVRTQGFADVVINGIERQQDKMNERIEGFTNLVKTTFDADMMMNPANSMRMLIYAHEMQLTVTVSSKACGQGVEGFNRLAYGQ